MNPLCTKLKALCKGHCLRDTIFVAIFAAGLTATAWLVRPLSEDGWLMLLQWQGVDIASAMLDKPLVGCVQQAMSDLGLLWTVGAIVHWLVWTGMGLCAMALWRRLYPGHEQYAILAALLAIAPIICIGPQLVLITLPFETVLGPMLVFAAMFVQIAISAKAESLRWATVLAWSPAVVLIFFASLLSEYTVPAGLACAVLLAFHNPCHETVRKRRYTNGVLFASAVIAGYVLFWLVASSEARPAVRPDVVLSSNLAYRIKVMPVLMLTNLWQGSIGNLLYSIGRIDVDSSYVGVAPVLPGIVVGVVSTLWVRRHAGEGKGKALHGADHTETVFVLISALALGLLPIVLMGRDPGQGTDTRYWIPLLPIAACLSLRIVCALTVFKVQFVMPALIGFLAGYSTACMAYDGNRELQRTLNWSHLLKSELSDSGITVAVFTIEEPQPRLNWRTKKLLHYTLTARLTANWEPQDRERFYAFPDVDAARSRCDGIWESRVQPSGATIALNLSALRIESGTLSRERGILQPVPIQKVVWVHVLTDGTVQIDSTEMSGNALTLPNANVNASLDLPLITTILMPNPVTHVETLSKAYRIGLKGRTPRPGHGRGQLAAQGPLAQLIS